MTFWPLRLRPVTKSCGDEDALQRRRERGCSTRHLDWSKSTRLRRMLVNSKIAVVATPTLAMLSTQDYYMHPTVLQEKENKYIVYGQSRIGGSDTMLGTSHLAMNLELSANWANTEYSMVVL